MEAAPSMILRDTFNRPDRMITSWLMFLFELSSAKAQVKNELSLLVQSKELNRSARHLLPHADNSVMKLIEICNTTSNR
jgi:hypothetical protein